MTITVQTDDYAYIGQTIEAKIEIVQAIFTSARDFTLRVEFEAQLPEFIMDDFKVGSLTCSTKDLQWEMVLPSSTTTEISPVKMEIKRSGYISSLFILNAGIVSLSPEGIQVFTKEGNCPQ